MILLHCSGRSSLLLFSLSLQSVEHKESARQPYPVQQEPTMATIATALGDGAIGLLLAFLVYTGKQLYLTRSS